MRQKMIGWTVCLFFLFLWETVAGAAVPLRAFWKQTTYPLEDAVLTGVEPNVLFFLDDSTTMTLSMKGQMPIWPYTDAEKAAWPLMRNAEFRAGLLKDMTYGTGARTLSQGTLADQSARLNNLTLPFVSPHLGTEKTGYTGYYSAPYGADSDAIGYTRWGRDIDASNNIIGDLDCYYSPDPNRPYVLTFRN
ncbi:MAG: hypothetical protein LBS00_12125, partial [Synergistaceae bacterium]|nr:hypothetical protein [Synergistaceae bacterium]